MFLNLLCWNYVLHLSEIKMYRTLLIYKKSVYRAQYVSKVNRIQTINCHGCKKNKKTFNFHLGSVHFLMRQFFIHPLQRSIGALKREKKEYLNKLRLCLLAAFTPHNRALFARF